MLTQFRWKSVIVCLTLLAVTAGKVRAADIDKYLPKEMDAVISLNIEQVLDSAIVKKNAMDLIKTTLSGNKEVQKAIFALGIDPLKDLTRISVGIGFEDPTNPKAVIVVEGKFDVAKINATVEYLAKNEPGKFGKDSINGRTVYQQFPRFEWRSG